MVFQSDALYPHLNVFGNLAFALKMRCTPPSEIRQRVADAAASLDIAAILDRRGWELSGGQRRRVALGRAIVRRPAVFLLDEPLTGLDAALRSQIRREIGRLHRQLGTTMIYVTHDQIEAMTLAHRLAVLYDGRLQQVADPAQLYRRPANRVVASLLGSPPMNFLPGRIETLDGRLGFQGQCCGFPIAPWWIAALQSYVGRNVLLGIRPEHLRRSSAMRSATAGTLRATVHGRELLGAEQHVDLRWAGGELTLRADSHESFGPGETVDLALPAEELYFFDAITEQAIPAV
jgi:multiple sugar transport system ATP-binding protein